MEAPKEYSLRVLRQPSNNNALSFDGGIQCPMKFTLEVCNRSLNDEEILIEIFRFPNHFTVHFLRVGNRSKWQSFSMELSILSITLIQEMENKEIQTMLMLTKAR